MLTKAERAQQAETGMIPPSRLAALSYALDQLAFDARAAARVHPDGINSQAAAALRGKGMAYSDAAIMTRHIMEGDGLHPRSFSTARKAAVAWNGRRRARKAGTA